VQRIVIAQETAADKSFGCDDRLAFDLEQSNQERAQASPLSPPPISPDSLADLMP
jgi:hypothetical protein